MIFPYQSYLETERYDFVLKIIKQDFKHYVSFTFEDVAKEFLLDKANLPFYIQKIGRWWNKEIEIDIIALGDNEILFSECKYWDKPVGLNVLNELKEKSKYVNWKKERSSLLFFQRMILQKI